MFSVLGYELQKRQDRNQVRPDFLSAVERVFDPVQSNSVLLLGLRYLYLVRVSPIAERTNGSDLDDRIVRSIRIVTPVRAKCDFIANF